MVRTFRIAVIAAAVVAWFLLGRGMKGIMQSRSLAAPSAPAK